MTAVRQGEGATTPEASAPSAPRHASLGRLGASLRAHPERWIIAAAVLIRVPLLFSGLAHTSDIWRQSDTASMARNFWTGGYHLFLPRIDWGGAGPGYVESEFPGYPFLVALLYGLTGGEHVWLGKLVSLAFTAGTLAAFWGLARRVVDRRPALAALAFFAASPVALRFVVALAACLAMFGLATAGAYRDLLADDNTVLTACAASTAELVPEGDLIVVSSPYASTADGYDVNYQEPVLFYFSGRTGWSLAADRHDAAELEARIADGARWFVAYDRATLDAAPALSSWLDAEAEQVGPGMDRACGVWRLPGTG